MSTKMTHDGIAKWFRDRKFAVTEKRSTFNDNLGDLKDDLANEIRKGISIHVDLGDHTISIQAGGPNYCEPRRFAEEYEAVEVAVMQGGHFVRTDWNEGDDVMGWVSWETIMEIVEAYSKFPYAVKKRESEWD